MCSLLLLTTEVSLKLSFGGNVTVCGSRSRLSACLPVPREVRGSLGCDADSFLGCNDDFYGFYEVSGAIEQDSVVDEVSVVPLVKYC